MLAGSGHLGKCTGRRHEDIKHYPLSKHIVCTLSMTRDLVATVTVHFRNSVSVEKV